jgi:hypothetical protein
MTYVIKSLAKEKDYAPPSTWGALKWQMPDGMNAEKAQRIMRAFVIYTHSIAALCGELQIPEYTARTYLCNAAQISKSVVYKLPRLEQVLSRNPALVTEIYKHIDEEEFTPPMLISQKGVPNFRLQNMEASERVASKFALTRRALGMTSEEVAQEAGIKPADVMKAERVGLTPKAKPFFPLCEVYHIDPEIFEFVGDCGRRVESWRKSRGDSEV